MLKKYKAVLFDLDGTLSESGYGVKACISSTLKEMNKPIPDLSNFSLYVGPPLIDTFVKLCALTKEEANTAVKLYFKYYIEEGKYKNRLYDGLEDLLKELKDRGIKTAVATTKNEDFAKWVVEYIGVSKYFDVVSGVTADYSIREKQQVIRIALDKIGEKPCSDVVMIGDSKFDVEGANLTGCDFIGVTYGYGNIEEMRREGGKIFANNAKELKEFLL